MTGTHRAPRAALWLPGLAVTLGAAAATAHGLYEVALAAAVPAGIAWLYPLITDGLALVAYGVTARLSGSAARYAWAVVVTAAGLSGLAQAAYLASGATLDASSTLRFGIGAWPAIAAAIAAHLLYLLAAAPDAANRSTVVQPAGPAEQSASNLPAVQPRPALPAVVERPVRPTNAAPARERARAVALRHAARDGALPTVSTLADAAQVSRGTAASVLKPLREQPRPLHLITNSEPDDDTIEEQNQP
jgi:hypothetical protein